MKCLQCEEEFITTGIYNKYHPTAKRKFCRKQCREKHWRLNNKDKLSEYAKTYRINNSVVKCRYCRGELTNDRRGNNVITCSDECYILLKERQKQNKKRLIKNYQDRKSAEYLKFKEDIKCKVCGYSKYGGSLDFHHTDPNTKTGRINATNYNKPKGIEEMKKCILVCKNCHYEIHGRVSPKQT